MISQPRKARLWSKEKRVGDVGRWELEGICWPRNCVGGVPLEILAESALGKWDARGHLPDEPRCVRYYYKCLQYEEGANRMLWK